MPTDNLAVIAALEVAAVLLIICIFLLYQNRSLRALIKKLEGRMHELVADLQAIKNAPVEPPPPPSERTYLEYIDEEIEKTKQHHLTLDPDQDIALDLAPDTLFPRRAAAMRYAVLLAEKEAIHNTLELDEAPDWSSIRGKYQQIFEFYEDYSPESDDGGGSNAELEALSEELANARKRINNLEKFKALYFDLEEQWAASKENAQEHYNNLSAMASSVEDSEAFEDALQNYHASYNNIDQIIQQGVAGSTTIIEAGGGLSEKANGELRHLRTVAADQHKLITELQAKLVNADSQEERNQIIDGLKGELEKQKRFMQESDTCIQLMEDELNNAQKEVDQLRSRLKMLPSLKVQMQELKNQKDEFELKFYTVASETRKLKKQLQEEKENSPTDHGNAEALKKELQELEGRYANLEEKYLDLKMNS